MDDRYWSSIKRNTTKSSESRFQHFTALEGLVLDLQVLQADLRNLQGLASGIENSLRELEQWASVPLLPHQELI